MSTTPEHASHDGADIDVEELEAKNAAATACMFCIGTSACFTQNDEG
ncbi:hypothetical protein [Streptomyces bambusae]|uniref:Uncharacterized protein n=1 Tax=Streptomyces bambusae TaxID=1550616 RepID=A0ABS6ZC08_9ACTN|nr:hypothetical protein [Streptomyces bambusae]MBW5485261.1 hypothetical protein [Streptomyces bambusae]